MRHMKYSVLISAALLSLGLNQTYACEDNVQASIQLPRSLGQLAVKMSSKGIVINGVSYFLTKSSDTWCAKFGNQVPNCDLPKLIFVAAENGRVTPVLEKKSLAAIEFVHLSNGDAVLQLHEVKAPLNAQGFREFKTKGSVKARVYGRQMENGSGHLTWSMTVDAAKFDTELGKEAENISEGIEIRHEKSSVYARAATHPSLSRKISVKPSWKKDWNLNCVEGLFSYDDRDEEEDQNTQP